MYYSLSLGIEVFLSVIIIALILVCRGKGADVGAAFSGGASASVFGSRGSVPFTTKLIAVLCALFLINSLVLTYFANRSAGGSSVIDRVQIERTTQPVNDTPRDDTRMQDMPEQRTLQQPESDIPRLPIEPEPTTEQP